MADCTSQPDPGRISVAHATQVVSALGAAASVEDGLQSKVRALLQRLQGLLGFEADLQVLLYDELDRVPCPRIVERVWAGPLVARLEPRTLPQIQAAADAAAGMWKQARRQIEQRQSTPMVLIYSQDATDRTWFDRFREEHLLPKGWDDLLAAAWLQREGHLVQMLVLRKPTDRPFNDDDRDLMKLMVCAAAPLIDRAMFRGLQDEEMGGLSARQKDVLHLLLRGMSEKEAARALHRSSETVHNHVRAIYRHFGVSSRGELMAQFIDRRALERF